MKSQTPVRGRGFETEASVYDDGRLRVEHDNYYVACGGQVLQLPRKEFLLLSRLALNAERVVSSADLWRHAWPPAARFNAESLHVHIYRLRRRLAPFRVHIETMINVGYRLVT
ncbi:MAG TPA: helix-turn-helix domain-containing protein [Pyrinomonadaceae bacterium]|nr:helix-turn-helix domain-containing protein [Pyrinomonadaceae bacterium]